MKKFKRTFWLGFLFFFFVFELSLGILSLFTGVLWIPNSQLGSSFIKIAEDPVNWAIRTFLSFGISFTIFYMFYSIKKNKNWPPDKKFAS